MLQQVKELPLKVWWWDAHLAFQKLVKAMKHTNIKKKEKRK